MNKLYRFAERLVGVDDDVLVEEPKITTESIRETIKNMRVEDAERHARIEGARVKTREKLLLFPIGLPVSVAEIAQSINDDDWSVQIILNKLISTEDPSWKYVTVDGCTLYQRVK